MDIEIESVCRAISSGTSLESNVNKLLQNREYIDCMNTLMNLLPPTIPTTREGKDACIQLINESFDTDPVFQTQLIKFMAPVFKSYFFNIIENPSIGGVASACDDLGFGPNDREDVLNVCSNTFPQ